MFKIIILDYSILVQRWRESALFSKEFRRQVASLGHAAGSPCFLSFCCLRCIVLTCSILGSLYLKSTVNSLKCSNQCCSILGSVYLKSTVNLQKCSNHSCSILGSVYLKSTVNLQKHSNQCCSIPANVYLKNT